MIKEENNLIKIKVGSSRDEYNEVLKKVNAGLIKFAYYYVENDSGYHVYIKNKK
jgi:hypothetical protein